MLGSCCPIGCCPCPLPLSSNNTDTSAWKPRRRQGVRILAASTWESPSMCGSAEHPDGAIPPHDPFTPSGIHWNSTLETGAQQIKAEFSLLWRQVCGEGVKSSCPSCPIPVRVLGFPQLSPGASYIPSAETARVRPGPPPDMVSTDPVKAPAAQPLHLHPSRSSDQPHALG